MADVIDILLAKKVADNGLLSKIQIGNKTYELKDTIAREKLNELLNKAFVASTGVFADDKAVKDYVDSQVGSINKFDVRVLAAGEALPTASAETMYILYLKPDTNAEADSYIEYITVRAGEEGSYVYAWEAIGSTKMDLADYVKREELDAYTKTVDLGSLAFKDNASGKVASETITGVKATGTSAGSISVALSESTAEINSTGAYTPAGTVNGGKVKATGSVEITVTNADAQATLATADYQPAGNVSVELAKADVQVVTSAGTAASFTEGAFTAATLEKEDVTANYATEGLVGSVNDDECLVFTNAGIQAITATKVNSFNGGSKEADKFTPNVPAAVETKTVATGVNSSSFTGTVASGLKVTGVTYQKHDAASAKFTGDEVDVTGASFSGAAATIEVSGNGKAYAVDTANTKFNPAAIELAVGDITVSEKTVTVE